MKFVYVIFTSLSLVFTSCGKENESSPSKQTKMQLADPSLAHTHEWQDKPDHLVVTFSEDTIDSVRLLGCRMKCCGSASSGSPRIEKESDEKFHIRGMRFHKQGTWRVHLGIKMKEEQEEKIYIFEIKV